MNWNKFKEIFSDSEIIDNKILIKSKMREAIIFVKEHYSFRMLKEIIAIHLNSGLIELIYHLYSIDDEEDLYISIEIENEIETVSDIFPSAIADENEIYDLFGVKFIGHDGLKRLYMPDKWKGHPLRKDYIQDDERLDWNE